MHARAIFLDRDGTLVHPQHYPSRPEDLLLYEGVAPELQQLQSLGFRLVVITNQSGMARGFFTAADLQRMHDHLQRELHRHSSLWLPPVTLDAIYYCPHHEEGVVPELAVACDCRKPQPGMLLRAAADLQLDLGSSWLVGDILDDVEAGARAGCRTILVELGTEPAPTEPQRRPDFMARDTVHALRIIRALESTDFGEGQVGRSPACDLTYFPERWRAARHESLTPSRELNGRPG